MIVTIFGDVHGNLIALEKLFQIERSQTDLFISHGDVVNYGPWQNECVQFLEQVSNCTLLKGNHENYFIKGEYDGTNNVARSFFEHCYAAFEPALLNIINKYQNSVEISDYTIQHTIGNQYVFKDTDISKIEIDTNYIIGHSHQQFEREKNNFKIYNTGSIGQNRQSINQSCYLKYDTESKKMELKNFIHDVDKVINEMISKKYPSICIDYYLSKSQII